MLVNVKIKMSIKQKVRKRFYLLSDFDINKYQGNAIVSTPFSEIRDYCRQQFQAHTCL